jgi:hypothetical protein
LPRQLLEVELSSVKEEAAYLAMLQLMAIQHQLFLLGIIQGIIHTQETEHAFPLATLPLTQQVITLGLTHTPQVPPHTLLVQLELRPTLETHIHLDILQGTIITQQIVLRHMPHIMPLLTLRDITPDMDTIIIHLAVHMGLTLQMDTGVSLITTETPTQAKIIMLVMGFIIIRLVNHMQHTLQVDHIRQEVITMVHFIHLVIIQGIIITLPTPIM